MVLSMTGEPTNQCRWRYILGIVIIIIICILMFTDITSNIGHVYMHLSFHKNGSFLSFHKDSSHLYIEGVPVKPEIQLQTCDKFIPQLKEKDSVYYLLAMYDPGNCAEVANSHLRFFDSLPVENETAENYAQRPPFELTALCDNLTKSLGDPNWRLCYGMPESYHYGRAIHQRYIYGEAYSAALEKLGPDCFDRNVAIYFFVPNIDHQGGPRKVLNNLMTGFRLIGKPYVVNARKLEAFDYLYSPDPSHGYFMYYIQDDITADKLYLGPTVIHTQFHAGRITEACRKRTHIVAASKKALASNQYFPRIPVDTRNAVIIPTGVDETLFLPSNTTRTKAFLYIKANCKEVFEKLKGLIKLPVYQVNYGSYNEEQFRTGLRESKYGIVCDGAETQGIAMEEMMAMDVPLFVLNAASVPYFSDQVGKVMSSNQAVESEFQTFVKNVDKGVYKPRKWLIENLGIANAAINTMKVFCKLPNKWN